MPQSHHPFTLVRDRQPLDYMTIATVYAYLADDDRAIEYARWAAVNAAFEPLRGDPTFSGHYRAPETASCVETRSGIPGPTAAQYPVQVSSSSCGSDGTGRRGLKLAFR